MFAPMLYHIRNAAPDDISDLEVSITALMQEAFQRLWGGTPQKLAQDGFGLNLQ